MNLSLDHIVAWIIHYKYLVIFPFAVFEGPVITIITGFLASIGQLNFWVAFGVVGFADLVGDTIYYCLGRFGRERFLARFGKFFGLNPARVQQIEGHFQNHPWKIFGFGKIAHGTGSIILAAAGLSRVPYWEFLGYNIPTTLVNTFALVVLGFYFGQAYNSIDQYLKYYSIAVVILLAGLYIYLIKRFKNYSNPE